METGLGAKILGGLDPSVFAKSIERVVSRKAALLGDQISFDASFFSSKNKHVMYAVVFLKNIVFLFFHCQILHS